MLWSRPRTICAGMGSDPSGGSRRCSHLSPKNPPASRCSTRIFRPGIGRPGLFLEDLYVREWARSRGVGRRLIARLAAIAIERDWTSLHFNVLDWNPARGFYRRLGIAARGDWLPHGATGDALSHLAAQDISDVD